MSRAKLLLNDVHRSLYGSVARDLYDQMLAVSARTDERPATTQQQRAVQTVVELLERLGTKL